MEHVLAYSFVMEVIFVGNCRPAIERGHDHVIQEITVFGKKIKDEVTLAVIRPEEGRLELLKAEVIPRQE